MNAVGVICEYNPFHLGHQRHLLEARSRSGADAVVCVMSGAAVQRGELAVLSGRARAEAAVRCGADLVLSLPLPWSVSSAERFAEGGVSILARVGHVGAISFGSECGDAGRLSVLAEILAQEETRGRISELLRSGCSYAAARERAVSERLGREAQILRGPNDNLGVEYLLAARRCSWQPETVAVRRLGEHDGAGVCSSRAVRELLQKGQPTAEYLPEASERILRREIAVGRALCDPEAASELILAALRRMTDGEYAELPDGGEGLWMRLARCGRREPSLAEVLDRTKTRRYAYSRLRRMAVCAYLGIRAGDNGGIPPYSRILAMNETGRRFLRQAGRESLIPLITRTAPARALSAEIAYYLDLESRGEDLRALALPPGEARRGGSFWREGPLLVADE